MTTWHTILIAAPDFYRPRGWFLMKTIVVTGAAGNLGSKLRAAWVGRYALRLIDKETHGDPEVALFDLSVWSETWADLFVGAQAVIHLAANPMAATLWMPDVAQVEEYAAEAIDLQTRLGAIAEKLQTVNQPRRPS